MKRGPLDGVRVTDFTWVWAGPYATELLAFLGAEVIKVESMRSLDTARIMSITTGQRFDDADLSTVFLNINLNKLSVRLNLSRPEAVALAKRLVAISDVVAQNMRPGTMDRLGLGYEALREVRPDLVYLSSSAFGATGPYWNYTGYAPGFAAFSGLAHATGYVGGPPNTMSGATDLMSGTNAAFAVLAALNHRARTGEGQFVDLSSPESLSVLIGDILMDYTMNRRNRPGQGNRDEVMAPHNVYPCRGKDRWVSIAVATDEEWRALCHALGHPEWTEDPRLADGRSRWLNQEELDRLIGEWTVGRTHYEVMHTLQAAGVAAMPVFSADDLLTDPHLEERQVSVEVEHPRLGKQTVINTPWKMSGTPAEIRTASPLLGEHNRYVFGDLLGLNYEEVARLEEEGVLY